MSEREPVPEEITEIITRTVDSWVESTQEAGFLPPPHFVRRGMFETQENLYLETRQDLDSLPIEKSEEA